MQQYRVCKDVDDGALGGNDGQKSRADQIVAGLSDEQVLVRAQCGDGACTAILAERLGGLVMSDTRMDSTPLGGTAIRVARAQGGGLELAEEIVARVYAQIMDPGFARYDPARGSVEKYIYGLCRNAARLARPTTARPLDPSDRTTHRSEPLDGCLSLEDRECVCWAYNKASEVVRRAFARLRGGCTLDEAARAAGLSRRSLKRQIDAHVDWCRGIMVG